ncbi:hypothetical protein DLM75_16010 [Leptospira stimsonii]|uniref:Uncharacterized protein n=1 Tax=Leptospira stimsonii TaxID=2202203 RepID=A0A396Z1D0_9LEPT|nr:hypothetical protein DLM75_16010 [Leptospira stimsonii]
MKKVGKRPVLRFGFEIGFVSYVPSSVCCVIFVKKKGGRDRLSIGRFNLRKRLLFIPYFEPFIPI